MTLEPEREWIHAHEVEAKIIGWVIAVALLGALFVFERWRYAQLLERNRALALEAVNTAARLDSTRRVRFTAGDSVKLLGDSLAAVTRLTVQLRSESDLLDHALSQTRSSNQALTAQVRELVAHGASAHDVAVDSAGTRRATFVVDSTPYHATADVALPAAGRGTIDLRVRLDAAHLRVRTGCRTANVDGVRAAQVAILSPSWLAVVVDSSAQDPDVCNHVAPPSRGWFGWPALVAGVGRTFSGTGSSWGAFVGVGARIGR